MVAAHHARLHSLQKLVFKDYADLLPELPFASAQDAGKPAYLEAMFEGTLTSCFTIAAYWAMRCYQMRIMQRHVQQ